MTHKIVYTMVKDGFRLDERLDDVELPCDVVTLRKQMHAGMAAALGDVCPAQLAVYRLENQEALESFSPSSTRIVALGSFSSVFPPAHGNALYFGVTPVSIAIRNASPAREVALAIWNPLAAREAPNTETDVITSQFQNVSLDVDMYKKENFGDLFDLKNPDGTPVANESVRNALIHMGRMVRKTHLKDLSKMRTDDTSRIVEPPFLGQYRSLRDVVTSMDASVKNAWGQQKKPVFLVGASPGMGKSAFIDALRRRMEAEVEIFEKGQSGEAEAEEIFASRGVENLPRWPLQPKIPLALPVVVDITFNHLTTASGTDEGLAAVACRIAFRCLGLPGVEFEPFRDRWYKMEDPPSPLSLLALIGALAGNRIVMVMVDEPGKAMVDLPGDAETCGLKLYEQMSSCRAIVLALFTALGSYWRDSESVKKETSATGRDIKWIVLPTAATSEENETPSSIKCSTVPS